MWSVDPPQFSVAEVAALCVQRIKDRALAQRVRAARPALLADSARLQTAAATDTLHLIDQHSFPVALGLTAADMKGLYKNQLGMKDRPAYVLYQRILHAALHRLCSYCQYGAATTLDHVVPKDRVPALAIDPWNLVPSCADCNRRLRTFFASEIEKQLLHPYFMPPVGRWLVAAVREEVPVTLDFAAEPDPGLTPLLQSRVRNQFAALHLGEHFAQVTAQQVTGTSRILARSYTEHSAHNVRAHLHEQAELHALLDVNDLRAVAYEALGNSEWYCAKGFRA